MAERAQLGVSDTTAPAAQARGRAQADSCRARDRA